MKNLIFFLLFAPLIISAQKVGVNKENPLMSLDVKGKILISEDTISPVAGSKRFHELTKEFEGFDGDRWVLFSASNLTDTW